MNAPSDHVVLLGAGGMLATALERTLQTRGVRCTPLGQDQLDLVTADFKTVLNDHRPSLVVNAAAWTDVDGAEQNEDLATEVNGHAVGRLADACAGAGVTLVHYSTDYVFDGTATEPYATDHPRDPVNAYGRSKAVGELAIEHSGADHLLVRTSWVYAPWGKNFVLTMSDLIRERDTLSVVDDQRGRPSSATQLASTTLRLLDAGARGTYHATDAGECTWFGFACAIRDRLGASCDIRPCSSDAFPRPATRPAYSVLDVSATESEVGLLSAWEDELASVIG